MQGKDVALLLQPALMSAYFPVSQVQLLGQPISVGRPSGYVDPSTAQAAALAAAEALDRYKVRTHLRSPFSGTALLEISRLLGQARAYAWIWV